MYPVILKLLEYRDKLYSCQNTDELLNISTELHRLIDDVDSNSTTPLDPEIRSIISILSRQIAELFNKNSEYDDFLIRMNDDLNLSRNHPDTGSINYYSQLPTRGLSNSSDSFFDVHKAIRGDENSIYNVTTSNVNISNISTITTTTTIVDQKKTTRQQMNPLATLWFIKYLIDHDLCKPDKNNRHLLSLLTNVPEHDIDRWFIRTNQNYIKSNDKKIAREKLIERAKTTSKQLRRPSSLKTSGSNSTRGSPYTKPTRGQRDKHNINPIPRI
uniref:HD1-like protein n=1 Tax=Racocetra castanea TaxID=1348614 RepID=A0A410HFG7_9GLOM|nr:HD1-like protein [Racocetra castanea]